MVALGTGVVDLPVLAALLRQTRFTGAVMGEGASAAMRKYMADTDAVDVLRAFRPARRMVMDKELV